MRHLLAALFLLTAAPASATCAGQNLLDIMPAADRAALTAAADAVPYPRGNFWRATRGDAVLYLIGTYHFEDPRHAATVAALSPALQTAATLLVEAGPDEEALLIARLTSDVSVMVNTTGPTLPELLPEAEWQALANAMRARGIPPFMAAKFQPWYVSMLLATPACAMEAALSGAPGLDALLTDAALAANIPVRALEPYDTVFRIFGDLTPEDQISMIRATLATEPRAADFAATLADAYFAGQSRLIWELSRRESLGLPGYTAARVDAEFARMEESMMASRNRDWIGVIEDALQDGPAVAAFGALHLSGTEGVLALLETRGFTLTPLPLAQP